MSMPKFPDFDPEITCEHSLNMVLASIAMEELALSHIINAEGEKLQYVLGTLEKVGCIRPDIDDILRVNQSVTCLLDSVSQNQMILKNKMDKALHALAEVCPNPPYPPCPPGPSHKCTATFKAAEKCRIWCPDSALHWDMVHQHGECVRSHRDDKTKIELCSKGWFMVYFTVNVRTKSDRKCNAAISLQKISNQKCIDIYTVHSQISADTTVTMSMNGVIINTFDDFAPDSLMFSLVSHDPLTVSNSMLSIIEL